LKEDDGEIYKLFSKNVQGRDKCYLRTRYKLSSLSFTSFHGELIDDNRLDTNVYFDNRRNRNLLTMEDSVKFDSIVLEHKMQGLNKICEFDDISLAMEKYSTKLDSYYDNKIMTTAVTIDPRRSFLCLVDSGLTSDIKYDQGPTFKSLNLNYIDSTVAKTVYQRKHLMTYNDTDDEQLDDVLDKKMKYKESVSNFFQILKNDSKMDLTEIKFRKALMMCSDPELLIKAKTDMTSAQREYMSSIDKKGNKGIKLTQDELQIFKTETNWSSNRGYKLYDGKLLDITINGQLKNGKQIFSF